MGTKTDPGNFDCYAAAAPDEPMFILLARDHHAPLLVRLWAALRELDREDAGKVSEARACAAVMEIWREASGRPIMPALEALETLISGELARQHNGCSNVDAAAIAAALAGTPRLAGDDDEGADPTKPGLFKPRGNGGVVSPEICHCALLLVGDTDAPKLLVESWPQEWRDRAYDWAMRLHLQASDNDDVYVPPRPHFVPHEARPVRR